MGVTEPAMYGVNMKYKKPFAAAMIGSAVGAVSPWLLALKPMYSRGMADFRGYLLLLDRPFCIPSEA